MYDVSGKENCIDLFRIYMFIFFLPLNSYHIGRDRKELFRHRNDVQHILSRQKQGQSDIHTRTFAYHDYINGSLSVFVTFFSPYFSPVSV